MDKKWSEKSSNDILDDVKKFYKILKKQTQYNHPTVMTKNELKWYKKVQKEIQKQMKK